MTAFLVRRVLLVVPVLFGVSIVVFGVMAAIPGDPALAILGPYATPETLAALRADMGLDASLPTQYVLWLDGLMSGDLGHSYSLDRPVADEVADRLGPTMLLAASALLICTTLGLGAGVVAATRQFGWIDRIVTTLVLVGISTPAFWLAVVLILVFSARLGWFPVSGMTEVYGGGGVGDVLHHLVLPALALGVVATGAVARLTRTGMLEVLRQDYIRTARAKGVGEGAVIRRHAFRNAVIGLVPVIGLQAGFVLGGTVYIETVFQWPGLGRMLVQAIAARDILLVQGGVLVLATAYVLLNLAADAVQRALDPRIAA